MTDLPEDVRMAAEAAIDNLDWSQADFGDLPENVDILDAVAPLIIEWARKDQAEKDAQIVLMDRGYSAQVFWVDRQERAATIRAQFNPETTGGKTK